MEETQMTNTQVKKSQESKKPKMLVFIIIYLFNLIITPIMLLFIDKTSEQNPVALLAKTFSISQVITLVYALIYFKSFLIAEAKKLRILKLSIAVICGYILTIVISSVVKYFLPDVTPENQTAVKEMFKVLNPAAMFLLVVVAAPIVEELIFRQAIIGNLSDRFNVHFLAIISTLVFAFAHAFIDITAAIMYLGITVPIVAIYRYFNNNVVAAIAMHAFSNLIAFVIIVATLR